MKSMIKRATMALLILGFATTSTAQFGEVDHDPGGELTYFGCTPIPMGSCWPY